MNPKKGLWKSFGVHIELGLQEANRKNNAIFLETMFYFFTLIQSDFLMEVRVEKLLIF
jgi:hypothetical protein